VTMSSNGAGAGSVGRTSKIAREARTSLRKLGSVRRRDCGHEDKSCPWTTSSDRAGRISRPSILRSRRLAIRRERQRPITVDSPRSALLSPWTSQSVCRRGGKLEWRVGGRSGLSSVGDTRNMPTCRLRGRYIDLHSAAVAVTLFTFPVGGRDSPAVRARSARCPLRLARPLQFVRRLGRDR